ncbi:phage tail protein [Pseudomonas viridiflava]|uniref:phage tail protein n=1 Tax=Pseudomonas viridiflava TaxID=33069 RepID=UPI00197B9DDD|nr:phage tail protein [Pseudomonas viridiflava]
MGGFELKFSTSGWAEVEATIANAPKLLDLAAARALRKTAQWLRTHSSREIAKELKITQSPLRHRYNVYSRSTGNEVKLWVGLQPLSVHWLGKPKATSTGVSVGHREYADAFISPMKTKHQLVFRRKGRERLPVELVREDWADEGVGALERWETRAMQRFVDLFESEAAHVFASA